MDAAAQADAALVWRRLLAHARPYAGQIALTLVLAALLSGGLYLRAWLLKPVLDDLVLPQEVIASAEPAPEPPDLALRVRESFTRIALIACLVVVAVPLLQLGRGYGVEYVLGRIHVDLQRAVCAHLLALPLGYHRDRRRGDVLSRTLSDVGVAVRALTLLFGDVLQSAVMLVVGLGVLAALSWQLTLLSLLAGPVLFAVMAAFGERIRRSARRRQEKVGDVTQRLLEMLAGIKVIKAFRAEAGERAAFARETEKLFRRGLRAAVNREATHAGVEMLNHVIAFGTLLFGAWLVLRGRWGLSAGDLAAYVAVSATAYRPLKSLARGFAKLADAQPSAERLFEVLDTEIEIPDPPDALPLDGVSEGVTLRHVSFSYGGEPVLRDVSFHARAGDVVAIVGRTGAGKTTLVDLLLRFHDPDEGSIEIDDVDLRRLRRDALLDKVAVVGQEPFLFDGTIRENIRYGRPDASDEALREAARAAHVLEFAERLPDGLDTRVGAEGLRLSGGQRQRITIARALLRNPALLVLDEATSALDAQSERLVQDATLALLEGRTVFVIAHRLSTIRRADAIVVLDGGRVVQSGTHDQLSARPGPYRDLVHPQQAETQQAGTFSTS